MCLEWAYSLLFFSLALCIFIKGLESWYPLKMQSTIIINDTVSKKDICYFCSIGFPREQKQFFFFFLDIVLMCRLCNFGHLSFALGGKLCPCFRQHPAFSSATWTLSEHKLLHGLDETRDLYLISGIRKQFIRIKAVRLRDFLSCLGSH